MFRAIDLLSGDDLKNLLKGPMVIAIDGPTASGKGTLALRLAKRLGFAYMDTGVLYRGVAKTALDNGLDPENADDAAKAAKILAENYSLSLQEDPSLRLEKVSQAASQVASVAEVRNILLDIQKNFAKKPGKNKDGENYLGVVMDGRDVGTVICPDAHIKMYIDADAEIRAARRVEQLVSKGIEADQATVLRELEIRDGRDSNRDTAPLEVADDAFTIDSSSLNANEVLARALDIVRGYLIGAQAAMKMHQY